MSNNPLDNLQFTSAGNVQPQQSFDVNGAINQYQQNPRAFEQQIQQNNPQGYQEILRIKNSANPKQEALKFAQSRGVPPYILKMFGLM